MIMPVCKQNVLFLLSVEGRKEKRALRRAQLLVWSLGDITAVSFAGDIVSTAASTAQFYTDRNLKIIILSLIS